jgi:hypothetical protein
MFVVMPRARSPRFRSLSRLSWRSAIDLDRNVTGIPVIDNENTPAEQSDALHDAVFLKSGQIFGWPTADGRCTEWLT